jgi:microcystin-dependent protein
MDSFLGQIRLFGGIYAPEGWALCNGASLPITGNEALFALIGTIYGGNGTTNFNLPNLQMRLPVGSSNTPPPGMASAYQVGSVGGAFEVTLTEAQIPAHTHAFNVTPATGSQTVPAPGVLLGACPTGFTNYAKPTGSGTMSSLVSLSSAAIASAGGSQAHTNAMPTIVLNYIICTTGLYPNFS